jgi:hypothetical protein
MTPEAVKTRRKNGWWKNREVFVQKRREYMLSDKNPFLGKKHSDITVSKMVEARRNSGSFKHTEAWKIQQIKINDGRIRYDSILNANKFSFPYGRKIGTIYKNSAYVQA